MFSKTCEYAIRATIFIAAESYRDQRVGLQDIAIKIDSPEAFTAKILQTLVKHKVINSTKGPSGGFDIPKDLIAQIKLAQIVSAIDGDAVYNSCAIGLKQCSEVQPCPVHNKFKNIREELKKMLCTTTLEELALGIKSGSTYLKI
ncbi:RrF2 family transcriptional regulator [Flavobacterium sp. JP2137]|uniref:RrF2 family transcriptional regulator n=1 Tax=Flavobacterium sp. JP2137 TaxID=3414510 RepID=UPI003D2FD2B7